MQTLPRAATPLAVLLASFAATAQADWSLVGPLTPKAVALQGAAYHVASNHVVMFSGNNSSGIFGTRSTWVWSAGTWTQPALATQPTWRRDCYMAYHQGTGKTVLFGGRGGNPSCQVNLADTWLWDGSSWTEVFPATSPTPRYAGAMAYDPRSGNLVLFGGYDGVHLNDTWTWDGTTWTQVVTPTLPPTRADQGMASDWARNQIVMFGGNNATTHADTWIFDSALGDWTQSAAVGPAARTECAMASDYTSVYLYSGDQGGGLRDNDLWRFDGLNWSLVAPVGTLPGGREEHVLVDQPGEIWLNGGYNVPNGHLSDTWVYNTLLNSWTESPAAATHPIGGAVAATCFDPVNAVCVLVGGYQDTQRSAQTWERDAAGTWTETATFPGGTRPGAAMAYDAVRGECVLFGGIDSANVRLNDTWVYNAGTDTWTQKFPVTSPVARTEHTMTFDAGRGTVVLFGGYDGGNRNDTWEWDGTNWAPVPTAIAPLGRHDSAIEYDAARNETILFGGYVGSFAADTWALRAGGWVQLAPVTIPAARSEHALCYDAFRERIVMFGGQSSFSVNPCPNPAAVNQYDERVNETWEWDGANWIQRTPLTSPPPSEEHSLIYDSVNRQVVLALGWDHGHLHDTWTYSTDPSPTKTAYSSGCNGATLDATLPWVGETLVYTATLPTNALAACFFGASAIDLPLDAIGMPGCRLATTSFYDGPMVTVGTTATLSVYILPMPSTIGLTLRNQVFATAGGPNPSFPVVSTNGVELVFGMK